MTITDEALVVGAGPVGLFAALSLAEKGVSVNVVDAEGEGAVRGHACCLHSQTLQLFDEAGLLSAVLDGAHRVDGLSVHGHGAARQTAFSGLASGYPYALTLRQSELEAVLTEALRQRGSRVSSGQAVTSLEPHDGFVRVTAAKRSVSSQEFLAHVRPLSNEPVVRDVNYVVAADGYLSECRRLLGVDLITVLPPKAFVIYDFLADLSGWEHEARIVSAGDSVSSFWPLGPNLGRWTFQVWLHLDETPSLDALRLLLRQRAPWFTPNPEQVCWSAMTQFEHRIVRRFGNGRTWLAGDAAHTTSPIGFQSMNRGFCEAEALSKLVADSLYGTDHRLGQFDRLDREQQAVWEHLFGLVPSPSPAPELAACLPASGLSLRALQARLGL